MTLQPQPSRGSPTRPTEPPTLRGMAAFLGVFGAIFLFVSYPLVSVAVLLGGVVTAVSVRSFLVSQADPTHTRTLRIPGVGAIEYRITSHARR